MTGVIRNGDSSTPDPDGSPPRPPASYSGNVFANSKNVTRVSDPYIPHGVKGTHVGIAVGGSTTVFVNGLMVHRIGDLISCGSTGNNGSINVLAGG